MTEDLGGGASRSTDPAQGTSAATDVSLREYESREIYWLGRLTADEDRHTNDRIDWLKELHTAQREADQLAIKTAFDASQELAAKHNDLIRAGEKKDETYATKDEINRLTNWQSKIIGGMLVLGAIGVSNLVKVWTG